MKTLLLLPAVLLATGCCMFGKCEPKTPEATPAPAAAVAVEREYPGGLHWFRDSAEQRAAYLQTYATAAAIVDHVEPPLADGSWAVVLDIDETVLDNSQYQKERWAEGKGFDEESWNAWCRRSEATPLPGAKAFLERVKSAGGNVVLVSNRGAVVQAETEANLRAHAIPYDQFLPKTEASDKNPRFQAVANGTAPSKLPPQNVILFVGDNIQDFPAFVQKQALSAPDAAFADFGAKYLVLPNPMYGSWERNEKR